MLMLDVAGRVSYKRIPTLSVPRLPPSNVLSWTVQLPVKESRGTKPCRKLGGADPVNVIVLLLKLDVPPTSGTYTTQPSAEGLPMSVVMLLLVTVRLLLSEVAISMAGCIQPTDAAAAPSECAKMLSVMETLLKPFINMMSRWLPPVS